MPGFSILGHSCYAQYRRSVRGFAAGAGTQAGRSPENDGRDPQTLFDGRRDHVAPGHTTACQMVVH